MFSKFSIRKEIYEYQNLYEYWFLYIHANLCFDMLFS